MSRLVVGLEAVGVAAARVLLSGLAVARLDRRIPRFHSKDRHRAAVLVAMPVEAGRIPTDWFGRVERGSPWMSAHQSIPQCLPTGRSWLGYFSMASLTINEID